MKGAQGGKPFRSGFVCVIGAPNAGKSTLVNRMVGQKVSIVSDKAQTTRRRVMGVVSRPGIQMVFLDTPGVTKPQNRLGDYMYKAAYEGMEGVEAVLYMADACRGLGEKDAQILERLAKAAGKTPVIAAINKCDAASLAKIGEAEARLEAAGFFSRICRISAREGTGLDALWEALAAHMPEGPLYFPEDMVTDQPERQLCAELIREQALLLLKEEVPHGVGVEIEGMEFDAEGEIWRIHAAIYCERESHKPIVIGKKGAMLKALGSAARKQMEWMLASRVHLQLWVKVREDWRNSPSVLKTLGYE